MSSLLEQPDAGNGLATGIEAARDGSASALGQVLEVCRNYLLLTANQELQPALRAKIAPSDVVQKTYLEACRDFGQFQGRSEADLLAWLRSILRNNLANVRRDFYATGKRQLGLERPFSAETEFVPKGQPTPVTFLTVQEQKEAVVQALEVLPTHYREVLKLRHEENLSFAEISQRIGRSEEATRKLWARAVEELKSSLKPVNGPH